MTLGLEELSYVSLEIGLLIRQLLCCKSQDICKPRETPALQDCDLCKITICSSFRAVRGACEMSHILPRGVGGEGVQGASPCSVLSQPPAPSSKGRFF